MSPRAFMYAVPASLACWAVIFLIVSAIAHARCQTHRCWHRVHVARAENWLWRHYRAHPMPACTWVGESSSRGDYSRPYGMRRYRARNGQSSAGGKFQILDRTWYAFGGSYYRDSHPAAAARPLEQERVARRVLAGQGIHAWVGC